MGTGERRGQEATIVGNQLPQNSPLHSSPPRAQISGPRSCPTSPKFSIPGLLKKQRVHVARTGGDAITDAPLAPSDEVFPPAPLFTREKQIEGSVPNLGNSPKLGCRNEMDDARSRGREEEGEMSRRSSADHR